MRAADDIIAQATTYLSQPAFTEAFGVSHMSTTDAEGIVRAANQLGDYYERLLELAEECRTCSAPKQYVGLVRDCERFMNQPLQDFGGFVNDVLERLEHQQRRVILGQHPKEFEPVPVRTTTDGRLVWSILDRLQAIE